jgi:O-methyltransferase
LFDIFAGLPQSSDKDDGIHSEASFACSLEMVRNYLVDYPAISFHQRLFADSGASAPEARYWLVHFDVDLCEETRACLESF